MKNFVFIFLVPYFIFIIESGLMIHLSGIIPNLLILYALFFNVFENSFRKRGLLVAGFCGLFFDVISSYPLGIFSGIFLLLAFILKLILQKYVRIPFFQK